MSEANCFNADICQKISDNCSTWGVGGGGSCRGVCGVEGGCSCGMCCHVEGGVYVV